MHSIFQLCFGASAEVDQQFLEACFAIEKDDTESSQKVMVS